MQESFRASQEFSQMVLSFVCFLFKADTLKYKAGGDRGIDSRDLRDSAG